MNTERIMAWILALGGEALVAWIRNPIAPLYLYGPPATGKTLFQSAWERARPNSQDVITGQDEKSKEVAFFNARSRKLDPSSCLRIRVARPCTAADEAIGLDLDQIVAWLRTQ